jgi:hypothetical protein
MRFLEIVLAGLRVATREYTLRHSPIGPAVITPARAGSKRKFMKVIQSSLDQAQECPVHTLACVIMNFFSGC